MELVLRQRPLFPVWELHSHVNAIGEQNVENAGEWSLAFLLNFVIHYSGVNDPVNVLEEVVELIKLLEVINQRWNAKAAKSGLTVFNDVRQLEIELRLFAEFKDVNDENLMYSSNC